MTDPTPTVDEFLAAEKTDPTAWWRWWRLRCRDHLNLFKEAVEQRDAARADRVCWREEHNQVAAERDTLRAALHDFLDALVLAKRNDDVVSVVDGMLEVYVRQRVQLDASPTEETPVRSVRECEERYLPATAAAKARAVETPEQTGQRIARDTGSDR